MTFSSQGYVRTDTRAVGRPEQQVITYARPAPYRSAITQAPPWEGRGVNTVSTRERLDGGPEYLLKGAAAPRGYVDQLAAALIAPARVVLPQPGQAGERLDRSLQAFRMERHPQKVGGAVRELFTVESHTGARDVPEGTAEQHRTVRALELHGDMGPTDSRCATTLASGFQRLKVCADGLRVIPLDTETVVVFFQYLLRRFYFCLGGSELVLELNRPLQELLVGSLRLVQVPHCIVSLQLGFLKACRRLLVDGVQLGVSLGAAAPAGGPAGGGR